MTKLSALAIAGLLAVAFPAHTEPVTTAPCAASAEYSSVGLAGAHQTITPASSPSFVHGVTNGSDGAYEDESVVRVKYRLDLSGSSTQPFAKAADIRFLLRWDSGVSDYDMYVYDSNGVRLAGSNGGLPNANNGDLYRGDLTGAETEFLPELPHCTDVRIDIVNFIAQQPQGMTLETTIGDLQ